MVLDMTYNGFRWLAMVGESIAGSLRCVGGSAFRWGFCTDGSIETFNLVGARSGRDVGRSEQPVHTRDEQCDVQARVAVSQSAIA